MNYMTKKTVLVSPALNATIAIIGLCGVWYVSHNWLAVLWAIFGAMHVEFILPSGEVK